MKKPLDGITFIFSSAIVHPVHNYILLPDTGTVTGHGFQKRIFSQLVNRFIAGLNQLIQFTTNRHPAILLNGGKSWQPSAKRADYTNSLNTVIHLYAASACREIIIIEKYK